MEEQGSIFTFHVPGPEPKVVKVRFPSDEQWIQRRRKRKVVILASNGESVRVDYQDVDDELVKAIRVDDGLPPIDPADAEWILKQLEVADVEELTREGATYRVVLSIFGAKTVHFVRAPRLQEIKKFRTNASSARRNGVRQEITLDLSASGAFYGILDPKAEGYAGPVPVIHQAAVIDAVVDDIERPMVPEDVANFPEGSGRRSPPSAT